MISAAWRLPLAGTDAQRFPAEVTAHPTAPDGTCAAGNRGAYGLAPRLVRPAPRCLWPSAIGGSNTRAQTSGPAPLSTPLTIPHNFPDPSPPVPSVRNH